jgi:hypothetical protein
MITVTFQMTFRAEMHVNNIFFIFKKLFSKSIHQNIKNILNFNIKN